MIRRVLVVEDDLGTQVLFKRLLLKIDAELHIRCAITAEEAFRILNEAQADGNPYDLVVCDLNLPASDGLSLQALCQRRGLMPEFLFVSDISYEGWCEKAARTSDWPAFMRKPISEGQLRLFWRERFSNAGSCGS